MELIRTDADLRARFDPERAAGKQLGVELPAARSGT